MLSLDDAELRLITELATPIAVERRDAYLKSVAVALAQCTSRSRGLLYRVAMEERRRFLEPPGKPRSQASARFNGHA
jgi:hypothetical protein